MRSICLLGAAIAVLLAANSSDAGLLGGRHESGVCASCARPVESGCAAEAYAEEDCGSRSGAFAQFASRRSERRAARGERRASRHESHEAGCGYEAPACGYPADEDANYEEEAPPAPEASVPSQPGYRVDEMTRPNSSTNATAWRVQTVQAPVPRDQQPFGGGIIATLPMRQ